MTTEALTSAIRKARQRWSDERSPPRGGWETAPPEVGTENRVVRPRVSASVPTVPTVPTSQEKGQMLRTPCAHVAAWYEWAERAAILEFESGLDRTLAERLAASDFPHRAVKVL